MARMIWAVVLVCMANVAQAELQSLFPREDDAVRQAAAAPGSLFAGGNVGMFTPPPPPPPPPAPPPDAAPVTPAAVAPTLTLNGGSRVDRLLSLIALAEAGSAGYDAVQHGARVRPTKPPTRMTLGEIYAWIDATPGQPHAIGRYQFIPDTLRRVAGLRGYGPETPFTPEVQDSLALVLLEDAGLAEFQAGRMERDRFMHNLARIWAGLPLPNGRSYYDGYAGNKATITWATFAGGMARIWPVEG